MNGNAILSAMRYARARGREILWQLSRAVDARAERRDVSQVRSTGARRREILQRVSASANAVNANSAIASTRASR
jgi:hypothetical protein